MNRQAAPRVASSTLAQAAAEEIVHRPLYAWHVVAVLSLLSVFSYIDRFVITLLVEPIRRDLGISDTQISLLMGFSFAIFFGLFGIPLGRLADSCNRRRLITIGCIVWSVMTAACGLARNYGQLFLLRMGVGAGEATLTPAAYSLITDYFPKERLATAISVYSASIHLGTGIAFILGGVVIGFVSSDGLADLAFLGAIRPWQIVFFIVGLPGIVLALLMYTVKEPARRGMRRTAKEDPASATAPAVSLRETWRYFGQNKATLICHTLGYTLSGLTSYTTWGPTVFIRNYGWSAEQTGIVYGTVSSIVGVLGILAGGRFADYLTERGYRDAGMRLGLIATLAWFPVGILFPLMPNAGWALAMLVPAYFLVCAPWGAAAAALQQVMPYSMRAQASAIYLLVMNIVGLGLGPTIVALVTDYVFHDDQAMNYSMLIVGVVTHAIAAVLLWKGMKYFRGSLDRLQQWQSANG